MRCTVTKGCYTSLGQSEKQTAKYVKNSVSNQTHRCTQQSVNADYSEPEIVKPDGLKPIELAISERLERVAAVAMEQRDVDVSGEDDGLLGRDLIIIIIITIIMHFYSC